MVEQQLRTRCREHFGVTLPQFDVLSELERADSPLTMSRLSQELMVSNGNVTGVVDRLERNGLVCRERPEHDRRVQYIELTEEGMSRFKVMAQRHEQWLSELFAGLSKKDMEHLQELLLKMRHSVVGQD